MDSDNASRYATVMTAAESAFEFLGFATFRAMKALDCQDATERAVQAVRVEMTHASADAAADLVVSLNAAVDRCNQARADARQCARDLKAAFDAAESAADPAYGCFGDYRRADAAESAADAADLMTAAESAADAAIFDTDATNAASETARAIECLAAAAADLMAAIADAIADSVANLHFNKSVDLYNATDSSHVCTGLAYLNSMAESAADLAIDINRDARNLHEYSRMTAAANNIGLLATAIINTRVSSDRMADSLGLL